MQYGSLLYQKFITPITTVKFDSYSQSYHVSISDE